MSNPSPSDFSDQTLDVKSDEKCQERIRQRIRDLKHYYTNLVIYTGVFVLCFIIWLSTGGAYFWPIWVFLGLSASAIIQGIRLGQMHVLEEYFPFLKADWEEEQLRHIMNKKPDKNRDDSQS